MSSACNNKLMVLLTIAYNVGHCFRVENAFLNIEV